MNRIIFFLISFFLLTTISCARAQINPLNLFFPGQTDSNDTVIISAAEKMKLRLTDEAPMFDLDIELAAEHVRNPFISKIPAPDTLEPKEDTDNRRFFQKRDDTPTLPDITASEPAPDFKLSGLIWNTPKPQAILDNQIINIGDNFQSWSIIKISRDGVLLESASQTRFLLEP